MSEVLNLTTAELAEANAIVEKVTGQDCGNPQAAIKEILRQELPDMDQAQVEELTQIFLSESVNFRERIEAATSAEDAREQFLQNVTGRVREMSTEEAVTYLTSLQYAAELAVDGTVEEALRQGRVPVEEIDAELTRRIQEDVSPERIEQLLMEIADSTTLETLLISGCNWIAEEFPMDDTFHRAVEATVESSGRRAIFSAALYASVRNGRLSQIGADVDPRVITAYANAGVECAGIAVRLASGSINQEQASSLLFIVGKAVKWLISVALTSKAGASVGFVMAKGTFALVGLVASAETAAAVALIMGIAASVCFAWDMLDRIADVVDTLCNGIYHTVKSAVTAVSNSIRERGKTRSCVSTQCLKPRSC